MWTLPVTTLAVAAQPSTPGGRIDVALAIGVVSLAFAAVAGFATWRRRRRQRHDLANLAEHHGFARIHDAESLLAIEAGLDELFGPGAILLAGLRKQVGGLTLEVVHYRFPTFRADKDGQWDPHTQESENRMITLVRDFDAPLPTYRLMPNSWALKTIGGERRNVFVNVEPFGWRNYVFGHDRDWIRFIFSGEAQHLLRQNKTLAIDSRRTLMAFYQLDATWLPDDFDAFARQCLALATLLRDRARVYRQPSASARQGSVIAD